jgi:hypothetical protein
MQAFFFVPTLSDRCPNQFSSKLSYEHPHQAQGFFTAQIHRGRKIEGKENLFFDGQSLKALRHAGFDGFCRSFFCHTFCHTLVICVCKKGSADANFRPLFKADFGIFYSD